MLRKVDYLDKTNLLAQQQEAIMSKIREMSKSHIVYPGLTQFRFSSGDVTVDPKDVPGLSESFIHTDYLVMNVCISEESGWTPDMTTTYVSNAAESSYLLNTLLQCRSSSASRCRSSLHGTYSARVTRPSAGMGFPDPRQWRRRARLL